jgi:hypothetical protein
MACQVRALHKWLASLAMSDVIANILVATAVWALHEFVDAVVGGPDFLTQAKALRAHAVAFVTYEAGCQLWCFRPTFHMLHHNIMSLLPRDSRCNPHLGAVWINEELWEHNADASPCSYKAVQSSSCRESSRYPARIFCEAHSHRNLTKRWRTHWLPGGLLCSLHIYTH